MVPINKLCTMNWPRFLLAACFCLPPLLASQTDDKEPCRDAQQYPNPEPVNMVYPGSLVVGQVHGRVVMRAGDRTYPGSGLRGEACLSLFTENTHEYVAKAQIDQDGQFEFGKVRPGNYRLHGTSPLFFG